MWKLLDATIAVQSRTFFFFDFSQGLAIAPLVFTDGDLNLNLWLPDLQFMDQVDSILVSQSLKLKPKGSISWSRHISLVLTQPQFHYEKYPMDSQNITIRFASPSLANTFVAVRFERPPVAYINAPYPNEDKYNFPQNSIWDHKIDNIWATIFEETQVRRLPGSTSYNRTHDHGTIQIEINRRSDGVLIRLGLPVLMLMVLSGFVYWAAMENRIDSTMTILLSVSALYIVVFGNIPLLGYLTSFDQDILAMFLILAINVVMHQLSYRLSIKTGKWPLRQFFIRLLEFFGRVTVIPVVLYLFTSMFESNFVDNVDHASLIGLTVAMTIIFLREFFGVKKAFQASMIEVQCKVDESSLDSLSWYEVILYYLYFGIIRKLSRRRARTLSHKPNGEDPSFAIELKNKVLDEIHNPSNINIDLQPDSDDDEEVARQVIKQAPRTRNSSRKRAVTDAASVRKESSSFSL